MENKTEDFKLVGRIYKIIDDETKMFYLGSTTRTIKRRLQDHASNSVNGKIKVYKYFTPEKFKSGNLRIELIEEVTVKSVKELRNTEDSYIQKSKDNILCLNTIGATLNYANKAKNRKKYIKQYYKNNKDKVKTTIKRYRKKLQEKTKMISALKQEIKENFQNYLLTVIDMFKAYKALQTNTFNEESTNIKDETTRLLTVLKEQRKNEKQNQHRITRRQAYAQDENYKKNQIVYREQRKEIKREYDKLYRKENAEKIKNTKSQRIICQCGHLVAKDHQVRHCQTEYHKKHSNNINAPLPILSENN